MRSARGSARPMSSIAMRTRRRAEVERIGAAVEHAHEPVERGIGVGAAHRLVQRRDLVVERSPPLSKRRRLLRERVLDELAVDARLIRRFAACSGCSSSVEEAARIAVGVARSARFASVVERAGRSRSSAARARSCSSSASTAAAARTPRAREQRAVHLERRVLGGRADEGDEPPLDEAAGTRPAAPC